MTFHEHLARRRKALGLSQEELAAKIGVSRQAVSKWETGDVVPDLNRLLALAEALDTSLDALCGRETAESAAAAPGEPDVPPKKHPWLLPALCGFLAACLLAGGLWAWTWRNVVPAETAQAVSTLPDTFTVSGVRFSSVSDDTVAYQFTPSVSGDAYIYQITFTDPEGKSAVFDVPCSGGVCTGTAALESGWLGYAVTVSVSDGTGSRSAAVAKNLNFSAGSASWFPLTE
ncbi:helix-turn-helix transcriptional regulator [Oscillibacter valericigenes]|uniref:helix-turn-helix domain-containing protein n=1 Tax=Oscillibacter valericigenes TaxID=351091 RepID=UPI001F39D780|nr:helix-turn-helix transcriptional regulator [Oscillibacter valericigenes]MCF2664460.1 helix-turn-helix transcriptional regulator [Oscillibacter valericigenes]